MSRPVLSEKWLHWLKISAGQNRFLNFSAVCGAEVRSFILTSMALLGAYVFTLAPSVNLEWGGILITAADRLGVSITPGRPLWTLLAFLFTRLFGWASFCGHPNPAWGVNWLSAVSASLSGGLVAWWTCRLLRLRAIDRPEGHDVAKIGMWCGVVAGLAFGFSPVHWSQSVVPETFSLHLFLTLLALLLLDLWLREKKLKAFLGACFLFGLTVATMYEGFLLAPLILLVAVVQRPKFRHIPLVLLCLFLGFIPWVYLPLASARHPPVNWGYACSWDGFLYTILRGQFEKIVFSDVLGSPSMTLKQLMWGGRQIAAQYSVPVSLLAVPGVVLAFRSSRKSGGLLVAALLSYTVLLIWGLNPRLDAYTLVISARYLIPAFALIAIGIGVGLYALLSRICRRRSFCGRILALVLLCFPPLAALHMSFVDPFNLGTLGSPSQRRHTFGWQFGSGILNGREGLLQVMPEDISYPDPSYPPPMETNAVFFGGTDPGRFVPTYMIFCAGVRTDVAVITQNALASSLYLREMRDLYGTHLWIPAQEDMNQAFQQYTQAVKSNGRVQVQGVGGVMEINGILARMIFDRNKGAREFYVEESYVIPWMYPYLTPHGLIMKINNEPTELTFEMIRKDRSFWDWYVKRLATDPRFLRDPAARKTFSKLRSAIAGLYLARGNVGDAEYVFKQALELDPHSPEAVFRLADLYMRHSRPEAARAVVSTFLTWDVHNESAREFLNQIEQELR